MRACVQVAFYVVALPIGSTLAFQAGLGLQGLWYVCVQTQNMYAHISLSPPRNPLKPSLILSLSLSFSPLFLSNSLRFSLAL